jgi:hypothetical protein
MNIPDGAEDIQLNGVIHQCRYATFIKVGEALMEIRDSRLYRLEYGTFEEYCKSKWDISRVQAHRLIGAGQVVAVLPMGNKPTTERQARPLVGKPVEVQQAAWQKAVDASPTGQPTAREVEAAVEEVISIACLLEALIDRVNDLALHLCPHHVGLSIGCIGLALHGAKLLILHPHLLVVGEILAAWMVEIAN